MNYVIPIEVNIYHINSNDFSCASNKALEKKTANEDQISHECK